MNTPTLKTERLTLRKFTDQDIEALFSILREEEVNRFLPWYPLKDLEETRRFYEERYVLNYAQPQGYAYAICLKEDNIPVGYINIDMEEAHDLGYGLRKEFWNRGIVTEAAKTVIEQYWMITFLYVMILCTHWEQNIWLRILQSMQEKKVLLYDFISWYNWNFRKRIR